MSFPAYEKYKDSGVEWLGEVPEHWEVNQLRRSISFLTDFEANCSFSDMAENTTFDEGEPFAWLVRATDLENRRYGVCEENRFCDEYTYGFLRKTSLHGGEFLVTKRGEIGKIYVVPKTNEPATLGPNLYLVRLNEKLDPNFAFHWFKGAFGRRQLEIRNQSTTIGALYKDDLRDCICLMPPLPEQRAIASLLDTETSKIDGLVSEQRRSIELLKEKRQAVISHAVTKGLNPDVKMKPSGIQWLGDVPEHWEVMKLKHQCTKITDGEHISPKVLDEGVPLLSAKDVRDRSLQYDVDKFVSCEDAEKFRRRCDPGIGDLLIVSRGATIGRVGFVEEPHLFCLMGSVILLKLKETCHPLFMYFMLNDFRVQTEFTLTSDSSAQEAIYLVDVSELHLAVPPLVEQEEIASELENQTQELTQLEAQAERAIELLQERRTALISAAVTGKIDVRGYAQTKQEAVA